MSDMETQKKPSKQDLKKQQQYVERRQRMINQGVPPEQVDQKIDRDDYNALSIDKKVKRLEDMVQGLALGMSQDITAILDNQRIMADTYDINVRIFRRVLTGIGVTEETLQQVTDQVEVQWNEEMKAKEKLGKDLHEKAMLEQALQHETLIANTPEHPAHLKNESHDAATTFGG